MCGIFGIVINENSFISQSSISQALSKLFKYSESRGKEASGLYLWSDGRIAIEKAPIPASKFIKTSNYKTILKHGLSHKAKNKSVAIVGHTRLVTNGIQHDNENNQPVNYADIVGVHNGIIVNIDSLWNQHSDLARSSLLDSEVVMALLSKYTQSNGSLKNAITKTFNELIGSFTVAITVQNQNKLILASNTGSLFYYYNEANKFLLFASEAYILKRLISKSFFHKEISGSDTINQIKAGHCYIIDIDNLSFEKIEFDLNSQAISNALAIPSIKHNAVTKIISHTNDLVRCSKCILPYTMPYISFDEAGICNYCKDYQVLNLAGNEALQKALDPYRKGNGEPDCIVGFSGGRDSSYGLHLLKSELGMTPIAITYDWGMVTDLARRNQARICGKLGIEHIIVSANIAKKRGNIGKNIKAWLKKPELGMVPLFMAGDKQFFYYTNQLRKRAQIDISVMCVNPLEYTYFKSGFAGVENAKYYKSSLLKQLAPAIYYLKNFLQVPAYLNTSLLDTICAYFTSYFAKHNYIMLFDYLKWDEDEINSTLINQYGWEVAKDTTTTWRIGDGTAAFYNYIYYKVAGFTENDTFRSNQIREGIITRNQGLTLILEENRPRYESINEYLELVGLDYKKTMNVIDNIPKLYKV